jgi:anaerobic selenocysteine-containing dehydrogenase
MTPQDALIELLARVGARDGAAVLVSAEELSQWPAAAVAAMKSQKLLARARPAVSVVCPGCERECVMTVHTLPAGPRGPASFVVCDKRSDINRVPVSPKRLMAVRCRLPVRIYRNEPWIASQRSASWRV